MASTPVDVRIRMYNVGFGDCFLLTFRYAGRSAAERHVLIDFGSTAAPMRRESQMDEAAADIKEITGGRLDAVVATHRHADHISGFATRANGKGPGDVIRSISKNALVIQSWTEDPDLPTDAKVGRRGRGGSGGGKSLSAMHVQSLDSMHGVAEAVVARVRALESEKLDEDGDDDEAPAPSTPRGQAFVGPLGVGRALTGKLGFLGETNLKNLSAVKNLQTMSKRREFLSYGAKSALGGDVLPGVKVHVLGPPTIEQHGEMQAYAKESKEYWSMQAAATRVTAQRTVDKLFPRAPSVQGDTLPKSVRWFVRGLRGLQAQQLLELVRIVDNTLNNTSLILLFEVGGKLLLFPGDAQIENWDYALNCAKDSAANRKLLGRCDLYKVGHHGSLNATPKSLWKLFKQKPRMITLMSTRKGKHGSTRSDTEVPRETLVTELEEKSQYHATYELKGPGALFEDIVVPFGKR